MAKKSDTLTLLEIIKLDYARRGHRGPLSREMVVRWAKGNPAYCKRDGSLWPLWTKYESGSALPMIGESPMSRIMTAWREAGHPSPGRPGFTWNAFQAFADAYTDEYIELDGERSLIGLTGDGKPIYR